MGAVGLVGYDIAYSLLLRHQHGGHLADALADGGNQYVDGWQHGGLRVKSVEGVNDVALLLSGEGGVER